MLASAKSYNRVNDQLEIQTQSQMALNLIQEYVIDCTGPIGNNQDELFIFRNQINEESNGKAEYEAVVFKVLDEELQIATDAKITRTVNENGKMSYINTDYGNFFKVTDYVKKFSVSFDEKPIIIIELSMEKRKASYTGEMRTALRNKPPQVVIS